MKIEWDRSLETGVDEIDDQHREIFQRFEKLFQACSEGKGKDEVLQLVVFLKEYVKSHFSAEEKLQFRNGYPELANHKLQHAHYVAQVEQLEQSLKTEGPTLPLVIKTNQTLASWLIQHISKTDMEFAQYLRRQ